MVISNAKYDKRSGGLKNRGYLPEQDELNGKPVGGADIADFEIPLYRELTPFKLADWD